MIKLVRVSKDYGARRVLDTVSLDFAKGQTHVIWGSSGSGKTSILRLIAGLMKPSTGEIWLDGRNIANLPQIELAQQIGYVIQEGGLFPHLTARQNLKLATLARKWPLEKTVARINELAELVQIENAALDRFANQLSGGQRQRVALMRALMLDPALILLDEPLGALDPLVRSDLQKELKRIFNKLKKTVVIVTHDIGEGAFFGHTISLFHDGKLIQNGDFKSFVEHPENDFVSRFIHAQAPPKELIEAFK